MSSCAFSISVVEFPFGSGCMFVWWGWFVRTWCICLYMVPLYAYARWSWSRLSGKGVDAACGVGVYPCVPIGFGCGAPSG